VITPKIGIAIVAPGGFTPDQAGLDRAIDRLRERGCLVHNYYDPAATFLRFGGTDAGRLAQLTMAANDPQVQVVMALRGSYGISRLLPAIDFDAMAESGKLFVGYSDFTAFQMGLMAATGAPSFAGPMLYTDFTRDDPSDLTMGSFWQCLTGPTHVVSVASAASANNPAVELDGTLWGGNLSMLVHLLGTPYFPEIEGGILFVEDVNEHPYRVERMLLQLFYAGALGRQKALILGDFSGYRLSAQDNGYDFDAMLAYLRASLPIPVLTGLPFGHIPDRVTLPFGAKARLVSDAHRFELTMSAYPTLSRK
jgi:muramoyltetrapeptide carboxypeptidase